MKNIEKGLREKSISPELYFEDKFNKKIREMLKGKKGDKRDEEVKRKEALTHIFNCGEDQISSTAEEAFSGNSVFHDNHLVSDITNLSEADIFPKYIDGGVFLDNLTEISEGTSFSKYVNGDFRINVSELPADVRFPQRINGGMSIPNLIELPEGISFTEYIGGDLNLLGITKLPDKILWPKHIGGYLYLNEALRGHPSLDTIPKNIEIHWGASEWQGAV